MQLGVEYNPVAEELVAIGNWFALRETERRPAIIFGTSSDRIGTSKGSQQVYGTAAKSFSFGGAHVAPYVSVQYSAADDGINFPFGAHIPIGTRFAVQPLYDGNRSHLMGTWYINAQVGLTALWAWYERAGVAIFAGF